jgi:hypothetical protein
VTNASTHELASCLQVLKPQADDLDLWMNAMASGSYKFGYGLLRSADDEYDPFGVLAAISAADWTWNEAEGGWAVDDDALFLDQQRIADWLNMKGGHVDRAAWIERFQQALAKVTDGASHFDEVVTVFQAARRISTNARHRFDIIDDIHLRDAPHMMVGSDFSSIEDRVLRYMRPFYGRR